MGDFNPFNLPMGQGAQPSSGVFDPYSLPMAIHNSTADTPPKGPPQWFGSGASMRYERSSPMEMRLSGAWRDESLRLPVGVTQVSGSLMARPVRDIAGRWILAWALGCGPAASITDICINGTPIEDVGALYSATENVGWGRYLGTETQAVNSSLAAAFDWTSGWPWIMYVWAKFTGGRMHEVGLPSLTATVSMQAWDFTAGTPAWVESESPILHLYSYLVKKPVGPRLAASYIDTTSWAAAHTSWTETLISGAARWRAGGLLPTRDPMAAVGALLRSGWCSMPFVAGQFQLQPRKDNASPEAMVADSVRRSRVAIGQRPTVVQVLFPNAEQDFEEDSRFTVHPDLYTGDVPYVLRQDRPALLNAADVAARDARLLYESATGETVRYTLVVDPAVSPDVLDVVPGQVVAVSHPRWAAARQMRLERVKPGLYYRLTAFAHLHGKGFDIAGALDPDVPGPPANTPPDPPTSVNQAFVTGGDWAAHNMVPDEDDLTGWTATPGFASVSFDGVKSTVTALVDGTAKLIEYTIPSLVGIDSILVTFVARASIANPGTATDFMAQYAEAAPVGRVEIENNGTTLQRYVMILSATAYATPKLSIWAGYVEAGDSIEIQEFYAIPWSFRPSLSLLERWTWTEGASAATTVDRYELVKMFASGQTQLLASAPVGSVLLQAATYSGGALWGGSSWNQLNGSVVRLRVVGTNGTVVYVDADTQSVSALILGDVSGDLRDFDTSARATGKVPVWNATTEAHEYADVYTETETNTLLGGKVADTGDTMSGNLRFANNVGITCDEAGVGGTERAAFRMNAANQFSVGNASNALRLLGSETRPKYAGGDLALKSDSDAAIQKALVTTKGDLIAATAASTPARLAIGATDGYPLVVASAQAAGMMWGRIVLGALADQAQSTIVGRASGAGTGAPSALSASQVRTILGTGALALLSTVGTDQIDAGAVTNAKAADMADGTVKLRVKGGGTGDPTDGDADDIIGILAGSAAYTGDTETGLRLLVCGADGIGVGYVDLDIRGGVVTSATYHSGFSG